MKVIYVIDTLDTGGTEKSLLHITSRFKNTEAIIVTLFGEKHDLLNDFMSAGIEVIKLGISKGDKFWLPKAVKRLNRVFAQHRPNIVHAHLYNGELAARLTSKKYGHILLGAFVNDPYVDERLRLESASRRIKIQLYKLLDILTAKRAVAFTSLTKAIAVTNAEALGVSTEKIKIIPRGRPIKNFSVAHPPKSDEFIFLCVARLLKRKGYYDLIQALEILKEKGKKIKVIAAGDGVDAAAIKAFAAERNVKNEIDFIGNSDNVPALLAKVHAFVLPSHYEGMGASMMEAMMAAKPIVVSDIEVFKEQMIDRETGLLFKTMDPVDLATKMEWMIDNYEEGIKMGIKARKFAQENFDIDAVSLKYEEYYRQLAALPVVATNQTMVA